ncbi:MAG TPA: TPM domain-containing protein, partial [Candidatus Acidoferrales bacterium]|nr:TPM domain-containing protein [Candidatus Acidoferrales bacterium]
MLRATRRLCLFLGFAWAVFLLQAAAPAAAQSAPKLQGQITDETGSLGSGTAQVQSALGSLLSQHNVQLYVVFVATSGNEPAPQLAQDTYTQNGLSGHDMVLLVAVNDRQ